MDIHYNLFLASIEPLCQEGHASSDEERVMAGEVIAVAKRSLSNFSLEQRSHIFDLLGRVIAHEQNHPEQISHPLRAMRDRVVDFVSRQLLEDDFSSDTHASLIARAANLKDSLLNLYRNDPEVLHQDTMQLNTEANQDKRQHISLLMTKFLHQGLYENNTPAKALKIAVCLNRMDVIDYLLSKHHHQFAKLDFLEAFRLATVESRVEIASKLRNHLPPNEDLSVDDANKVWLITIISAYRNNDFKSIENLTRSSEGASILEKYLRTCNDPGLIKEVFNLFANPNFPIEQWTSWTPQQELSTNPLWQKVLSKDPQFVMAMSLPSRQGKSAIDYEIEAGGKALVDALCTNFSPRELVDHINKAGKDGKQALVLHLINPLLDKLNANIDRLNVDDIRQLDTKALSECIFIAIRRNNQALALSLIQIGGILQKPSLALECLSALILSLQQEDNKAQVFQLIETQLLPLIPVLTESELKNSAIFRSPIFWEYLEQCTYPTIIKTFMKHLMTDLFQSVDAQFIQKTVKQFEEAPEKYEDTASRIFELIKIEASKTIEASERFDPQWQPRMEIGLKLLKKPENEELRATTLKLMQRQVVWNTRVANKIPEVPSPFLLPSKEDLQNASVTRFSLESAAASQSIPIADPEIAITELIHYLDHIEAALPATIDDEGITRSKEAVIDQLKKQINALSENGDVKDIFKNKLSATFKFQITNALRHIVKTLKEQEAAISQAPEEEQQTLREAFHSDLKEILWQRLGLDNFHCLDRLATDCEDLYYERIATSSTAQSNVESKSLSNRILRKFLLFRRNLFQEVVSHVKVDQHAAVTHRYYRALLGKEFGIGSTEMSQENSLYAGYRVMHQEERIRREMTEALSPNNIAAYFAQAIGDPSDKDIPAALVTEWIQEHYADAIEEFFLPNGEWNPQAVAIILDDLNILKRIGGTTSPPTFSNGKPSEDPVDGKPLSLDQRLWQFDCYAIRAEESRNLGELSVTIIELLNRGIELLGPINEQDEKQLLKAHRQLLNYLEKLWNNSFQQLMSQREGLGRNEKTLKADRELLQRIYNHLILLDAPEFQDNRLENAPQLKKFFVGARAERAALQVALAELKQRIDSQEAEERQMVVEAERMKQEELKVAAEKEERAKAAEANRQQGIQNANQKLEEIYSEAEKNQHDAVYLKDYLKKMSRNQKLRQEFQEAGLTKEFRKLLTDLQAMIKKTRQ